MKKRILSVIFALVVCLSLVGCAVGRKNDAKNLKIKSYNKSANEYVIEYIGSKLEFGKMYLTIKDEKLVNIYVKYNKDYKLNNYQIKIGSYTSIVDVQDDGSTVTLALSTPFKLVKETDSEGYETLNNQSISIFLEFEDAKTVHTTKKTTVVTEKPTTTAPTTSTGGEETTTQAPTTTEAPTTTTTTTTEKLLDPISVTLSTTAEDLLTFIRNKAPNTKEE